MQKVSSTLYLYDERYYTDARKMQLNVPRNIEFIEIVKSFNIKTMLDVGCGPGMLVKSLREQGMEAYGTDFSPVLKKKQWLGCPYFVQADAQDLPFPDNSFDLIFSSEFFEHLLPEQVETVFSEMKRVGKTIVAKIAYEAKLTPRQLLKHATNKPKEWWMEKLPGVILL